MRTILLQPCSFQMVQCKHRKGVTEAIDSVLILLFLAWRTVNKLEKFSRLLRTEGHRRSFCGFQCAVLGCVCDSEYFGQLF